MANRPSELRARTLRLDGQDYLVLSFRLGDERTTRLTQAEWAVARAVIAGAKNAEIAVERGRSVNTVAKQVASVFRKLGVRSRIELARALANAPFEGGPCSG
jgi:DNA-binding NarL/FixJ family response regulator